MSHFLTLFFTVICFSSSYVWAEGCIVDGKDAFADTPLFTAAIRNADSCFEAVKLAKGCTSGLSVDIITANYAYTICQEELQRAHPKAIELLREMELWCNDKYRESLKSGDSKYQAMHSYCYLSAIEWVVDVTTTIE